MAEFRSPGIMQLVSSPTADAQFVMATAVGTKDELITQQNLIKFVNAGQSVASVKDHGAVGDGVADDAPAFQAAILAEGVVLVPEGTYRLATNLALNSAHDNTVIQMLDGAVLNTDVGQVINLNGCTNVSITGGALDGQTTTRIGIWAINCTDLKISGVKVHDLGSATNDTIGVIIDGNSTRCTIENCHIIDVLSPTDKSSRGILFSGAGTVSQAVVTGNRVEGVGPRNDGDALVVQDYLADDVDILITNNYLSAAKRGLKLQQGGQTVVSNVIEAKKAAPDDTAPIAPITMQGSNVLLANNTVRSPDGCSDANILLGYGLSNVKIADNLFLNANVLNGSGNTVMDHIQLSGSTENPQPFINVDIQGNSFSGAARYAFFPRGWQCTNFSISGNRFYDTMLSTAFQLGSQPANSSNIDISGNVIEAAASMVTASGDVANGYSLTSNRLAGQYQTDHRSITSSGGGGSDESWQEVTASGTHNLRYDLNRRISVNVTGSSGTPLTLSVTDPGANAATDLGDYDLMLKNDSTTGEKTVNFSAFGLETVPTFTQLKGDVTLIKLFWTGSKWLLR
ncbi:MAG: hypothetical protein GY753_02125 [Gammaproteobacteria bacterium]|nr:hypothetical protein [Gammaproteobacteria bacterium]